MVRMHPVIGKQKAINICRAFAEGAPKGADCDVFYGVNESNVKQWHEALRRGTAVYVDNSFFDAVRGQQYRVAKNRVQIDPCGHTSDGKRFEALGLTIKPWKPFDPTWLAVEQSPSFMRCVAGDPHWFVRAVDDVPPGHSLKLRPWSSDKLKQAATLAADLAQVSHLITHSSAAAVEAVMAGVQALVSPMSALAHMICGHGTSAHLDQRRQFLSVLADNMWTLDEIREGKAWARLK